MPDEQNITNAPTEPEAPQAQPELSKPTPSEAVKTGAKTYTETEMEQIIRERLDREKAKRAQAEEAARKKAEEEAALKNQEWQKLAEAREKELADLQAQLKARELAELKRTIAIKVGLPEALAARLIGDTDKDIEADAKALLETLPKPPPAPEPKKPQPGIAPANPGANGSTALTTEQQRARIYGARTDPWDVAANTQQGGGAFFRSKGE